jgi:pseudouridine synthase
MPERRTLDRLLSRLGICSRAAAAEMVRAGRVTVGERVVRDPETWVDADGATVALDGRPVRAARPLAIALHKPKGYVTSFGDPDGRKTVYDLLGDVPVWIGPVGRLDRDSSGLLLLTNDTDLADRITSPAHGLVKRYRVTTKTRVTEDDLVPLRRGLLLDDGPTRPAEATLIGHRGPTSLVEVGIAEGRNRQVRRMFTQIGHPVRDLRRVAIGPIALGALASGTWRELAAGELAALRKAGGGGS